MGATPLKEFDKCETVDEAHAALAHITGGALIVIEGKRYFVESAENEAEAKRLASEAEEQKIELARKIGVMASRLKSQGHEEEARSFKDFETKVLDTDTADETAVTSLFRESIRINPVAKLHSDMGKKSRGE